MTKKESKQVSNEECKTKNDMVKMNDMKLGVGIVAKTKVYPEPNRMSWTLTITLLNLKIASNRKGLTKYFSPSSHAYVNELSRRVLHMQSKDQHKRHLESTNILFKIIGQIFIMFKYKSFLHMQIDGWKVDTLLHSSCNM